MSQSNFTSGEMMGLAPMFSLGCAAEIKAFNEERKAGKMSSEAVREALTACAARVHALTTEKCPTEYEAYQACLKKNAKTLVKCKALKIACEECYVQNA